MRKIINNKKHILCAVLLCVAFGLFVNVNYASAGNAVGDAIITVLSWIAFILTGVLGGIISLLIKILVSVANFQNIINVPSVIIGWVIVRDLCNMFIVLILLIIAFGTILKQENYSAKKLLPKLLIMAVLINFSKTIFGLMIDFSQVIMLTFTQAFANGHGWFVMMFNVTGIASMEFIGKKEDMGWSTALAVIAGVFASIITVITIAMMLGILVMRVIMLWIYTILSPLVFLGFAFDPIKKHTDQVWQDFIKQLIVGPVLAFFIWLALTTADESASRLGAIDTKRGQEYTIEGESVSVGGSEFFKDVNFQKYIITIALLIGGMMVAQQMGGAAGQIAGKGLGMVKGVGSGGLGAVKRISGYSAVEKTVKAYLATGKATSDEKARNRAAAIRRYIGKKQEATMGRVGKAGSWVGDRLTSRFSGGGDRRIKELKNDIDSDDNTFAENQKNIKNKNLFIHEGQAGKRRYTNEEGRWYEERQDPKDNEKWHKTLQSFDDHEIHDVVEKDHESNVDAKQTKINDIKTKQKLCKTAAKIGLGVVGGTMGAMATGGLSPLAVLAGMGAGALAGGVGIPVVGQTIKDAGKDDLDLTTNYITKQVGDKKEEMKLNNGDTVLATMDDATKSTFVRSAAAMEAMSRKLINLKTAQRKREEINTTFGGDKKLMGQVDALLDKNYPGATKPFVDLKSSNLADKAKAERLVEEQYEDGSHTMKDIDGKSLALSIDQLSEGLKTSKFISQFKELNDGKQSAVIRALQGSNNYKAQEKLAHVTNINTAFGPGASANKKKFTQSLTLAQLNDVLKSGKAERIKALQDAVAINKSNLSQVVQNQLGNRKNGIARSVSGDLGF